MMQGSEKELLPCPFCGGEAEAKKTDMSYEFTLIKCQECDAQSDERIDLEDAAEAWNRRAPAVPDNLRELANAQKEQPAEFAELMWQNIDSLYATAPQPPEAGTVRKPLTDAEIESATGAKQGTPLFLAAKGFAIAIERAHGIGSKDT